MSAQTVLTIVGHRTADPAPSQPSQPRPATRAGPPARDRPSAVLVLVGAPAGGWPHRHAELLGLLAVAGWPHGFRTGAQVGP